MDTRTRHPRQLTLLAGLALAAGAAFGCQPGPPLESARDFEARLRDLVALRRFSAADSLISVRARRLPGDAEVHVARGNLYFRMAQGAMANSAPGLLRGAAGDSGRAMPARMPDTLLIRRAVESLGEGIRRHPERLDIRLGLAFMFQQIGDAEAEIGVLREAIGYALQHPDSLRWSYGEPLPAPPQVYMPQVLHDYVTFYLDRAAPGDDVPMLTIARMSAEAYPSNNRSTNDVAFYYGSRGDWTRSLEFLRRAERADSTDALVLFNLGWAHENLGRRDLALRYYRRALTAGEAGGNSDIARSARERLAAIAGPTP